ncbi:SRPBCC domain-containing protein [Amycolatopsis rhabdoformis]|uniref:SRPBCC domain-containing protein n=1 Tax=Amycolatopsis rhabdoformis TaxID=1448059 RepID=A0ABZ1IEP8_9PSEU|nr:SRPBCC domain-containing protein [Amycolatopsis rhabdoformis]WSE32940.1 SRPBCC domain-containing protein [Amycolatopsis rhabdoformis]
MGKDFELHDSAEVAATPEQIWAAISTGPGIDSWYLGRNEVEGGAGGVIRGAFAGYEPEHAITAWDPLERLVFGSEEADGRKIAYEFLIEGREGGSSVLRCVTSGFLPGDDWEEEFEAMTAGGALFFRTLVEYVTYFAGRTATPITAFGPPVADWDRLWRALGAELGLPGRAEEGDRVRVELGDRAVEGVVYSVSEQVVAVRTADALYCFLQGFRGPLVACHHVFTTEGGDERSWQEWLGRVTG